MTNFVGAEYLIANMLIQKAKEGQSNVSLEELSLCGIFVQRKSIEDKVDAIFLISKDKVVNAIFDFSDYFSYTTDLEGQIDGIVINQTKEIKDLEERFMGYLPKKIVDFLSNAIMEYAA